MSNIIEPTQEKGSIHLKISENPDMDSVTIQGRGLMEEIRNAAMTALLLNEFVRVIHILPLNATPFLCDAYEDIVKLLDASMFPLIDTVRYEVYRRHRIFLNSYSSEMALQKRFYDEISSIIPGAKIIEYKRKAKHFPDAMIIYNGEMMPVEIKVDKFNNSALSQLNRYIKEYDLKRGVAVANKCTAKLTKNIRFIHLQPHPPEGFDPRNVPQDIFVRINPYLSERIGLSTNEIPHMETSP